MAATAGILLFGSSSSREQSFWESSQAGHIGQTTRRDDWGNGGIIGRILGSFTEMLRVTISAQVFTLPLVLYHFDQVATLSILANMCFLWLVPVISIVGVSGMGLMGLLESIQDFLPVPAWWQPAIAFVLKIPVEFFLQLLYLFKNLGWTVLTINWFSKSMLVGWWVIATGVWVVVQYKKMLQHRYDFIDGRKL